MTTTHPLHKYDHTKPVLLNLPEDVIEIVRRRVKDKRNYGQSLSQYLSRRVTYDIRRKHGKGRKRDA